jgi:hypothetical protein
VTRWETRYIAGADNLRGSTPPPTRRIGPCRQQGDYAARVRVASERLRMGDGESDMPSRRPATGEQAPGRVVQCKRVG